MNTLFAFILGIAVGVGGYYLYERREGGAAVTHPADSAGVQTQPEPQPPAGDEKAAAESRDLGDRISDKLESWNLTPTDIRRELAETGRVIRNKARVAGARIDDARIVSVVKAKYVLDDELKALNINVDCRDGHVTLRGQAPSTEAIGRAVALALETDGVVQVNAALKVAQ